jgi:Tn3 transposase DDE domain-containing protein
MDRTSPHWSVAQQLCPAAHVLGDRGRQSVYFGLHPAVEHRWPVVMEDPRRGQHVNDLDKASASLRDNAVEVGYPHRVTFDVVGQQHDQVAIEGAPHDRVEPAGFGHGVSHMQRPRQPRVVWEHTGSQVNSAARYLADETHRRRIARQLNKGENLHALRRSLAYAGEGAVRRRHHEQQTEQMWCLTLATNAIVTWTTEYHGLAVAVLRRGGRWIDDEVLAIWPTHHENVHFYGTHSVDIDGELAKLDTDRYRPVRVTP